MSTVIRPEVSRRNENWISRHRYYELKHFCMQYKEFKKELNNLTDFEANHISEYVDSSNISNKTEQLAILRTSYSKRIEIIETAAKKTDKYFSDMILRSVTTGLSYPKLKARYNIPCSKDYWYKMYRKFFFILSELRD